MINVHSTAESPPDPAHNGNAGSSTMRMLGTEIGGVFESLWRLADLQVHLWVASVKHAAGRIIMAAVFGLISIILIIAAAIFAFASVFHFLTDYLHVPTAWALLIFAGVFGLAALVLVLMAGRALKPKPKKEKEEDTHE